MTDFEDGIQRIVKEIVDLQVKDIPIVCIQGDCHSGKTELSVRLHKSLNKSGLFGFSGKIEEIKQYCQEIENDLTLFADPKFYLIEDLISPATFISIYRHFNRLPDVGVRLTRELFCADEIKRDLPYFHEAMKRACSTVKEPAFDLVVYNPDAKDKKSPYL